MTVPKSLLRLITLIDNSIKTNGKLTPLKAKELVLEADVQVEDMMEYADFDHPIQDCYGRKLVHHAGSFEVMVMSWNPRDYSSIHNHGYTEWGVVQVFGETHHMIYNLKNNNLSFAKKEILKAGEAIKVNNKFIHQMGNSTSQRYVTLHVYGSNVMTGEITADAKNFDLELDRIAHTCGGAFFNLPDSAVEHSDPGVVPTQEVFMHYAYLLLDYYNRQEQSAKVLQLKRGLLKKIEDYALPLSKIESYN